MINKKTFRYAWNDHIREGLLDQYRQAIGAPGETKAKTQPEEVTALVLNSTEELQQASTPESVSDALQVIHDAMQNVDKSDLTTALATMGKEKAKAAGSYLGRLLIEGKQEPVEQYLKIIAAPKPPRSVALLQFVTNFRQDQDNYYAFDPAALTEEMDEGKFLNLTSKRLGRLMHRNSLPFAFQKFIVAQGIVVYWETVISSNPQGLEEAQFVNAQKIGRFVIRFLQNMISSIDVDAEQEQAQQQIAMIADPDAEQQGNNQDQPQTPKWPKKAARDSNMLLRSRNLEEFGLIYDRLLYAYSEEARENQTAAWEEVEKQIKTNPDLMDLARMITNFGRPDVAIRKKFLELLQAEKAQSGDTASGILPPTSHGFMGAGKQGLQEQNQRWKYLAGIK